jgi:hypothetical protein
MKKLQGRTIKQRRITRRVQIASLEKKGYFKRDSRAFTTKRIIWGNIDKVPIEKLKALHKIMEARIKTKRVLRETPKKKGEKLLKLRQELSNEARRMSERIAKMGEKVSKGEKTPEEYSDFTELQAKKLKKAARGIETRETKIEREIAAAEKSRKIFKQKGRGDTVILNLGGVPVAFKINEQNLKRIENKIWPQTRLEPREVAIRRILIKHPRRKIVTIQKNLRAQGLKVSEEFIANVITKMIKEKLINRGYPILNKTTKKT